ncbi:MAG: M1 family metallopeptidase [Alphaproteobacteria bacterium]|nr:M1 family metallopeptidase [Alphaproteobacteria bacterium]
MRILLAALAALLFAAPAVAATTPGGLPAGVKPLSYALSLRPDAPHMRFAGTVRAVVATAAPVRTLVLNAAGMTITRATVDGRRARARLLAGVERLVLTPGAPLGKGRHRVEIAYRGKLNTATSGFFAMDSVGADGPHRTLMTNFEPTGARWLMPCWDEPDLKAVLSLDIVVPAAQIAVSNMPEARMQALPGGLKRVWFEPSPRMASYLFFVAAGDFERLSRTVAGVDLGVVTLKGNAERCRYALDAAAALLPFYNDYFGMPYPLPKLDLVVAPGTISGIAMENWGAIAYSQNTVFVDTRLSTNEDRQGAFNTVAHEMAHQWFGNLVTMRWWDDLWLNEGFASWMEVKAMETFHPDWRPWVMVGAVDREAAMREDAKTSSHPVVQPIATVGQSEETFDSITYKKGQATVQLIERYTGADAFRDGLRRYMKAHAYGNAVSGDFWTAIETASGKPVRGIAEGYTRTTGVPLVEAGPAAAGGIVLRQGRFSEDGKARPLTLAVPVALRAVGAGDERIETVRGASARRFAADGGPPWIVNARQRTYVRTRYAPAELQALLDAIPRLDADDQLGLLFDGWALAAAGYQPVDPFLETLRRLPADAEPGVWRQAIETLEEIDLLHDDGPARTAYRRRVLALLRPLYARAGWDERPGESFNMPLTRGLLLRLMARFGDPEVRAEAMRRYIRFLANPESVAPNLREALLRIVAMQGDAATFDRFLAMLRASRDNLEREQLAHVMTSFEAPALVERALDFALGPEALSGQGAWLVDDIANWHPDAAWRYALTHQDRMPADSETQLMFMPMIAEHAHDSGRAIELMAYARKQIPKSDWHTSEESALEIAFRAKIAREIVPKIDAWLERHPG